MTAQWRSGWRRSWSVNVSKSARRGKKACPTPPGKSTCDNVRRVGFFAANRTAGASRSTLAEISRPQPGLRAAGCGYSLPKQYQQVQLEEAKDEKTALP